MGGWGEPPKPPKYTLIKKFVENCNNLTKDIKMA